MTFGNNFDSDETPQNVGPHLRSELFDSQIIICMYLQNFWMKQWFFATFERKNLLSMESVEFNTKGHILYKDYFNNYHNYAS